MTVTATTLRVRPLPPRRLADDDGTTCRWCRGRGWRDLYDQQGVHHGERRCGYCKGTGQPS